MKPKTSQKEQVYNYINQWGIRDTNHIRQFGADNFIADPEKRARELCLEGKLDRRWITDGEMKYHGYTKKVMVYYIKEVAV